MAPPATSEPECLIIGCGYLGRRVATRWAAAGRRVAALTRRNADTLRNLGVEPVVGDVLDPASLRRLPAAATVLHAVATDRASGRSMREVYVEGLRNVLDVIHAVVVRPGADGSGADRRRGGTTSDGDAEGEDQTRHCAPCTITSRRVDGQICTR